MRQIGSVFAAALIVACLVTAQNSAPPEQMEKQLTADELKALLDKKGGKLFYLDVREPKEIEELGSVKGYKNIPLGQLERRLSEIPKDRLVVTL